MIIATIQEVNAVSDGCCPCAWPVCPEPRKECQSISRDRLCSDTDYTIEEAEYRRKQARFLAHEAWLATTPPRGPEPPDEPDPGDYPTAPEGYYDFTHGCYAPFVQPPGEPTDDIPHLYKKLNPTWGYKSEGSAQKWWTHTEADGDQHMSYEWLLSWVGNPNGFGDEEFTVNTHYWGSTPQEGPYDRCETYHTTENLEFPFGDTTHTRVTPNPEYVCTEAARDHIKTRDEYKASGDPYTLIGCPGTPGGYGNTPTTLYADAAIMEYEGHALSETLDRQALGLQAKGDLPEGWNEPEKGAACMSSIVVNWPHIGDLMEEKPKANPEDPTELEWPPCSHGIIAANASATATKARYRLGVPANYSTTEKPRRTYECQWDEVFFPRGYDRTIDDPDVIPPDPLPEGWEHPQIPDPDAPEPTLVESREWTWGGSMEDPWSEWFEIAVPDGEGETRIVNLLVKCWKSTRQGVKPTSHGEVWEVAEEES